MAKSTEPALDGAALLRLREELDSVLGELRSAPTEAISLPWLDAMVRRLMAQADRVLTPDLVAELHRLVGPLAQAESRRDLEVVMAQLDGWIDGLTAEISVLVQQASGAGPES